MRLLLDTHALLWFLLDDEQLSAAANALIADPANDIEISPASYWEIAIKISIHKYYLPEPLEIGGLGKAPRHADDCYSVKWVSAHGVVVLLNFWIALFCRPARSRVSRDFPSKL